MPNRVQEGKIPPGHVLQQALQPGGVIVPTKDYRAYMLYLNGWFMWWGVSYNMSGKSLGAGLTRVSATPRYPNEGGK